MKRKVFFMMLLAAMTALCACTSGTNGGNNGSDKVYYGGNITIGITQDLDSLDPHKAVAAGTKEVLYNIFEGLIKVTKDGEFAPAVAESYTISEDGKEYDFVLRKNVRFHNGKTVTAEDVIYSLKRVAGMLETEEPDVSKIAAFSIISDITKTDNGVKVTLTEPNTELIGYFTSSIIPCDYADQATAPVGTGPFKFVSYSALQNIIVAKNEDYYIKGVPYLDQVTFKICANTDAAFMELMGGGIDILPYLTNDQANQLKGKMDVVDGTMNLVQALFLNNAVAPFDNLKVRQAICYAINRQEIINLVAGGKGVIIGTNMFPSFSKYYDETLVDAYPYNVDKAKELLKEAGYPDGFSFTITIPSNYEFHVRTGEVIVEQLKKVGIKAEIKLVEWASWISDVYVGRDYETTIIGLDSKMAPSDVLRFYPTTASKNFVNYFNNDFDALFEKAQKAVNEDEKAGYYKQLEKKLTEDAVSAYLQSPAQLVAINKDLGGYCFYPIYVQDMSTIYFKTEPPKQNDQ
ncbi:MAG: ABC transporter substrate-binding protein [Lachnospiraceae bacterium]|nr:ABC transporter substrate-binding protein [Lachnospiraceae bacterium]